jgi:hypothetical protein
VRQLQLFRAIRKIVREDDFTGGDRQQYDAVGDLGDFFIGHRRVAPGEVHRMIDKVLNAGAAALGLIIYRDAMVLLAEILEPSRIDRERKAGSGADQPYFLSAGFAWRHRRRGGDDKSNKWRAPVHSIFPRWRGRLLTDKQLKQGSVTLL